MIAVYAIIFLGPRCRQARPSTIPKQVLGVISICAGDESRACMMIAFRRTNPGRLLFRHWCSALSTSAVSLQGSHKSYNELPGPRRLPVIGSLWEMGKKVNRNKQLFELQMERMRKYGMIYRDKYPGLGEFVAVHDPADVEKVYKAEGKWPTGVGSVFPLTLWRKLKDSLKQGPSLVFLEGEKWHKARAPISKFTMVPRKVAEFHEEFNHVSVDLLKAITQLRDSDTWIVNDIFGSFTYKWAFESTGVFVLKKRLGAFDTDNLPQETQMFMDALSDMFTISSRLVTTKLPLYKLWPTKDVRALKQALKTEHDFAKKQVEKVLEIKEEDKRALERRAEEEEAPDKVGLLTYLLHSQRMSVEEATTYAMDLLGGGVETTSNRLGWVLYHLATNQGVQQKLREEVLQVVGTESIVTPTHISNMPYLRGCIKESFRVTPAGLSIFRVLQEDVTLSGYRIPAGTRVVMPTVAPGRIEEFFPKPEQFMPERWGRENKGTLVSSPYASLPFGHGPRNCVGRRVAELGLHITLSQIVRKFSIVYPEKDPVGIVIGLSTVPTKPINLKFVEIESTN